MEGLDSFGLLEENGGYFVIEKEFEPMEQETGGTEAQAYSLPANEPEITAEARKSTRSQLSSPEPKREKSLESQRRSRQ